MEGSLSRLWRWFAHPLVVTVAGGLIAVGVTKLWDHFENKRGISHINNQAIAARQTDIIENLPLYLESSVSSLNQVFYRSIQISRYYNEERTEQTMATVNELWEEMREWEKEIYAKSPDGLLILASHLFRCKKTKVIAQALDDTWTKFSNQLWRFCSRI